MVARGYLQFKGQVEEEEPAKKSQKEEENQKNAGHRSQGSKCGSLVSIWLYLQTTPKEPRRATNRNVNFNFDERRRQMLREILNMKIKQWMEWHVLWKEARKKIWVGYRQVCWFGSTKLRELRLMASQFSVKSEEKSAVNSSRELLGGVAWEYGEDVNLSIL